MANGQYEVGLVVCWLWQLVIGKAGMQDDSNAGVVWQEG
jgi:hypothetical protein